MSHGYNRIPRREVSEASIGSNPTLIASPTSPVHTRHTYRRSTSDQNQGLLDGAAPPAESVHGDLGGFSPSQGLGISSSGAQGPTHSRGPSLQQAPGSGPSPRSPPTYGSDLSTPSMPGSADPLLSPNFRAHVGREEIFFGQDTGYNGSPNLEQTETKGHRASAPSLHNSFLSAQDDGVASSRVSLKGDDPTCRSRQNILHGKGNWLSVTIFILSIYSTVMSAVYLVIALIAPRWQSIHSNGKLTPSTASTLSTLFAKTIELSFVTVFVSFLGQELSRRAFVKGSKGVTIAEMAMRQWIMQPGTLITHWESVRYAALSFLGMISLTAALIAIFYTTAADALVAPQLKWDKPQDQVLWGQVQTKYANPAFVEMKCQTPIQPLEDPNPATPGGSASGTTCLQIQHAGQAFHNYASFLSNWTTVGGSGQGSDDLHFRPLAPGTLFDNTTIYGSWINIQNFTETSTKAKRRFHNLTMAMPHAGVFAAARDPLNARYIIQPEDLSGVGEYEIIASVPSPTVNIMCAGLTEEELKPFVWSLWSDNNTANDTAAYIADGIYGGWSNKTVVDDIFLFDRSGNQTIPTFQKLPIAFNTLLNVTTIYADGGIYLLAKAPDIAGTMNQPYELCSLRSFLTPHCTTRYHAALAGGMLYSHCEDSNDKLAYIKSDPKAPIGEIQNDWKNIASEWGNSLSLNAGITDGNASNARLLSEFIPKTTSKPTSYVLDTTLPSSAEVLAVLAGDTLLLSTQNSPFVHDWNYSQANPQLTTPQYQSFNASVHSQAFSSGGNQAWQKIFYIVLILVFITNIVCLVSLFLQHGQVTDFMEPQNLFVLSINSPPSHRIAGSCGGGPEKSHFAVNWMIKVDEGDHVYIENGEEPAGWAAKHKPKGASSQFQVEGSPLMQSYSALSKRKSYM